MKVLKRKSSTATNNLHSDFDSKNISNEPKVFKIASLYHFTLINEKNINNLQSSLLKLCLQEQIRGTLLLAHEGINGTIAGTENSIDKVILYISSLPEIENKLNIKYSYHSNCSAFSHIKVKIKKEIVTMGKPDLNIFENTTGTYIEPLEWNQLIKNENVILIDTRNDYEIHIGTFKNAINPKTKTFKDFPDWANKYISEHIHNNDNNNNSNNNDNNNNSNVNNDRIQDESISNNSNHTSSFDILPTTTFLWNSERNMVASSMINESDDNTNISSTNTTNKSDSLTKKQPIIAMFCTGGIRCEKATAYIKQLGVKEVYHLKGGILKYLETIPLNESQWDGECFVFDERVSVKHGLLPGSYTRCYACKMPLSINNEDINDDTSNYMEGLWCKYCKDKQTEVQTKRFRERQLQITLARDKGITHLGQDIDNLSCSYNN